MIRGRKKTGFQDSWLLDPNLKWVTKDPKSIHSAVCTYCHKSIALSNMGATALKSHADGARHKSAVSALTFEEAGLKTFKKPALSPGNSSQASDSLTVSSVAPIASSEVLPKPVSNSVISVASNEAVARSEILTCLNAVLNHHSFNSTGKTASLAPFQYPDSSIAKKVKLHKTKVAYSIVYGIAPFFHDILKNIIKKCDIFTVGFDESLNKYIQKTQMDLHVTYWCADKSEVVIAYFDSQFLLECKAIDLLEALRNAFKGVDFEKIFNVSMDGPNVNFKLLKELESFVLEQNPDAPVVIFIGSCGLHVVNNSFKVGMKITKWELNSFFNCSYYLFLNSPLRRKYYIEYGKTDIFPQKFCTVRWLENLPVAETSLKTLPSLRAFVKGVDDAKVAPESEKYTVVKSHLSDPLLKAKICFYRSVASDCQGFLTQFQSDAPLAPFLYEALTKLLRNLMSRFVNPTVLASASNLSKIDVEKKENLMRAAEIKLNRSCNTAISEEKVINDKDILRFRQECRQALITLCAKLIEKSPLKYRLTKGISFLDPNVAKTKASRNSRFETTLDEFLKKRHISASEADDLEKQFDNLSSWSKFQEILKSFKAEEDRLDHFWIHKMIGKYNEEYPSDKLHKLSKLFKMILIISHGNAHLERGFSVNKECVVENLKENSLVALRRVYDSTKTENLSTYNISKTMIMYYRNANSTYSEELKIQKKFDEEKQSDRQCKALETRKRQAELVQLIEAKKRKTSELGELEEQIALLKSNH